MTRLSILLAVTSLTAAEAKAAGPGDVAPSEAAAPARTQVVFGTMGVLGQVRGTLVALLAAELRRMKLRLAEEQPVEPISAWATETTRARGVLVVILLDGRSEAGWRLVVIDAARGRAIARALPGGIRDDAANVEAVVSVIVSAASALREGLEVASAPVAAVVGAPALAVDSLPASGPVLPHPRAPGISRRNSWSVRGAVGASVASFSPAAPTTKGVGLSFGASFRTYFEARAFGAWFVPTRIQSPFGEFRVARAFGGLAAGPVFRASAFSFTPEVGVVAERVLRYDASPAAGVFATEPSALYRPGGMLALRLRHEVLAPFSVELFTGAMYFGRRLDFTARSTDSSWSVSVWPAVAFAQLGLELATR